MSSTQLQEINTELARITSGTTEDRVDAICEGSLLIIRDGDLANLVYPDPNAVLTGLRKTKPGSVWWANLDRPDDCR